MTRGARLMLGRRRHLRRTRRSTGSTSSPLLIAARRRAVPARSSAPLTPTWPTRPRTPSSQRSPPARPACWRSSLWHDISDNGADARSSADARRLRQAARCSSRSRSACGVLLVSLLTDDYLRRETRRARGLRAVPPGRDRRHRDGAANDLIVLFLGLEMLSIALYVLAASHRAAASEPGGGHQVLRARRLLVGVLPVRHRADLRRAPAPRTSPRSSPRLQTVDRPAQATTRCCSPASRCCSSASAFKVAAVPFHFWTPDVYQGAPTPVTGVHGVGRQGRRRSPRCCACSWSRCPNYARRLAPGHLGARRAHAASSARCWPSCRPT